ncbi:PREDICTED: carbonic anhydrase 7 [Nicrophorus vespilloides]|uniref:Carbonic anhydrase n=1 Tax=Nicrophorus vespilloides TaxID=110193 RepID=A0ABM1NI75_NICVS|nr:PREDICTED: carbonic anhydrase 7 [Nicrophorus vespilloides]XP_017786526.1 PREDICTED: carbonic anhydrase 7 [Nicrophorus vespilloides]
MRFVWCFVVVFSFAASDAHRFGYSQSEQLKWKNINSDCEAGLQSPIGISGHRAIPLTMPALEMVRYHDLLPGPLELHNNGHSASVAIPKLEEGDPKEKYVPYIFGAKLNSEYEMEALHFHWGDKNNEGSEHVINDIRFPMEMHIIHRNRKYATMEEALGYRDGLTVLGFFFQLREKENKQLAQLVKFLPSVLDFNKRVQINETFTLASILPPFETMERFYTYRGSLTTPPCSEAVTWILFPDPLPVSVSQMNKFRRLKADEEQTLLTHNYREVQKLGPRRVFVRKLKPRGVKYNSTIHYSKWDWVTNYS